MNVLKFTLSFSLLLISCAAQAMNNSDTTGDFNRLYETYKLQAIPKLSEEQRNAFKPDNYKDNLEQGHAALAAFVRHIVQLASAAEDHRQYDECFTKKFTQYVIDLRDSSLNLKTIDVIDEMTAINNANKQLTWQERNALQWDAYRANKEEAMKVLHKFAGLTYELLHSKNLHEGRTAEEYAKYFVNKKIRELDALSEVK